MNTPVIALTTDFGASSPYVAQMKAVLLSALRQVHLVDVTHGIPPHAIRHAEVVMRGSAFAFPLGTVHIVVVDPGVGTQRRGIAVAARGLFFVGPDNGVLSVALREPGAQVVALDKPALFRTPTASTFHGRDVFAPIAAELAAGLSLVDVGSPIHDPQPGALSEPRFSAHQAVGETLVADRFGNLTTNLPARVMDRGGTVVVAGRQARWVRTYGEGAPGELLALAGSDGFLEVALREAAAATQFANAEGLEVVCRWGSDEDLSGRA